MTKSFINCKISKKQGLKMRLKLANLMVLAFTLLFTVEVTARQIELGIIFPGTAGIDETIGSAGVNYEPYFTDGEEGVNFNYGYSSEAVTVNPRLELTPLVLISLGRNPSLNIGGWWTSGYGSVSGRLPGESLWESEEQLFFSTPALTMWGEEFYSYSYSWDEEGNLLVDPSRVSTVYDASRKFSLTTFYLFSRATNLPGVNITWGLRYVNAIFNDKQRVNGEFEISDLEGGYYSLPWYDFWDDYYYYDNYDLKVTSNVKTTGIGPSLGIVSQRRLARRISLRVRASCSYLVGFVNREALFVDIDDAVWSGYPQTSGGEFESGSFYWKGDFPFRQSSTTIIPLLEGEAYLKFALSTNLTLTFGYFYSLWRNIPVPALFHYKSPFSSIEELWTPNPRKNILLTGPSIALEARL